MTGLEILDQLLIGHTAYHHRLDAWDLLDNGGHVVAVLCPRRAHVSIAPLVRPTTPASPDGSSAEVERLSGSR
jgi:hypothetical protein